MATFTIDSNKITEAVNYIKESERIDDVSSLLQDLPLNELPSRNFKLIEKVIQKNKNVDTIKLAYLSNFVVDMLPSYVSVYAAKEKLFVSSYVGGYNQYFQEVLTQNSALRGFDPNIIILILSVRSMEMKLVHGFASMPLKDRKDSIEQLVTQFEDWYNAANSNYKSSFIISNFPIPAYLQQGVADQTDPFGEMSFYTELNSRLYGLFSKKSNVVILDVAKLYSRFGWDNIFDPKLYYLAKMEWRENFLPIVSEEIIRAIIALKGRAKKCLIMDLDNTLWGGVVGEEGALGVKVGKGDPVSEAFFDFQCKIKALKNRGIMLCICSKNNEEDIRELFKLRTDMPLSLEDFVDFRINWENKPKNIVEMSERLNIGLGSMVFIDDSPAECSFVKQILPEVVTIQLPPTPETYPTLIDRIPYFEKSAILESDLKKTEQYHGNRKRDDLREKIGDLSTYLHSLETKVTIGKPRAEDLERVHQLFTKTNQFNVTTIRYNPSEILELYNSEDSLFLIATAKDRFGDLGIIGLLLIIVSDSTFTVDSFILSCRAMGRGVETAIMNHVKEQYLADETCSVLIARYLPTSKNRPVNSFFDEQGLELVEEKPNGEKKYRLLKGECRLIKCPWIKVEVKNNNG